MASGIHTGKRTSLVSACVMVTIFVVLSLPVKFVLMFDLNGYLGQKPTSCYSGELEYVMEEWEQVRELET